jgi:hypothetical protein
VPFSNLITGLISQLGAFLIGQLLAWTTSVTETALVGTVTNLTRSRREPLFENALLHQQLIVLKRQDKRPKLRWRGRAVIGQPADDVAEERRMMVFLFWPS